MEASEGGSIRVMKLCGQEQADAECDGQRERIGRSDCRIGRRLLGGDDAALRKSYFSHDQFCRLTTLRLISPISVHIDRATQLVFPFPSPSP